MAQRYRTVLLFGAPGAGKGTQGKMLGAIPGFRHFSTGDMFRNLDADSEMGRTFHEYSSRGELVPDNLTAELCRKTLEDEVRAGTFRPATDLLVLDGIPRSVRQTELMEPHIDVLGVLLLAAHDPEQMVCRLRKRALKESRTDDADEEVIRRRLAVYSKETEPVLAHYPAGNVHRIDAIGAPARVLCRILEVLAGIQETNFPNALT